MALLYRHDDAAHDLFARSFASDIKPNGTQRTTLIVAGCYIIIIGILWCVLNSSSCVDFSLMIILVYVGMCRT
jgi:hypothetical protein